MNWDTIFDEVFTDTPGASPEEIERFTTSIGQPMSDPEIAEVNRKQQNPFPRNNPLHDSYRPFDPAQWVIPSRPLPNSYLSLLIWSNGGSFRTGEREFGFFPTFEPTRDVRAMLLAYQLPQYMPGAIPLGFNGGGVFYLLDMRQPSVEGEYPVVCASAGYLSWEPRAYRVVADSFPDACRGKVNIEDLWGR